MVELKGDTFQSNNILKDRLVWRQGHHLLLSLNEFYRGSATVTSIRRNYLTNSQKTKGSSCGSVPGS